MHTKPQALRNHSRFGFLGSQCWGQWIISTPTSGHGQVLSETPSLTPCQCEELSVQRPPNRTQVRAGHWKWSESGVLTQEASICCRWLWFKGSNPLNVSFELARFVCELPNTLETRWEISGPLGRSGRCSQASRTSTYFCILWIKFQYCLWWSEFKTVPSLLSLSDKCFSIAKNKTTMHTNFVW